MLTIRNLDVHYGGVHAIRRANLDVGTGEAAVVLGANGAGKTTLLRAISGLVRQTSDAMTFSGKDIRIATGQAVSLLGLLHVPEGRQIFQRMTVTENLEIGALCARKGGRKQLPIADMFELFPRLAERRTQLAGTMSGGEQQMLAIARALIARPRLLMLDEPSMGLAPLVVDAIYESLKNVKALTSLLIVEQNMQVAMKIADRAYVLQSGDIVHEGPAHTLSEDIVRRAYLGAEE